MKKVIYSFLLLCFTSILFAVPTDEEVIKNICKLAVEDGLENEEIGVYLNNLPEDFYLSFDYIKYKEKDCSDFLDFDESLASSTVLLMLLYKQAELFNPEEFYKLKTDYETETEDIKNKIESLSADAPKSEKVALLNQKVKVINRYKDAVINVVDDYKKQNH